MGNTTWRNTELWIMNRNISPSILHWLLSFLSLLFSTAWAIASFSCCSDTCDTDHIREYKKIRVMRSVEACRHTRRHTHTRGGGIHTWHFLHSLLSGNRTSSWKPKGFPANIHTEPEEALPCTHIHLLVKVKQVQVCHTLGSGCRLIVMWTGPGVHWLRTE